MTVQRVVVQLQRAFAKVAQLVDKALIAICAVLLCFLVVSVFVEVLIRYVIHAPSAWTEEVAQFVLVWFGLLAAAVGARRGMHFAIRFGVMYLNAQARWVVRQICNVLVVLLLALLLKQAVGYLDIVGNQYSMATEINMQIPYAGIPVGIAMIMLMYAFEVIDAVLSAFTGCVFSLVEEREERIYQELKGEVIPEEKGPLPVGTEVH